MAASAESMRSNSFLRQVLRGCMTEGLAQAEGLAVDASIIKAKPIARVLFLLPTLRTGAEAARAAALCANTSRRSISTLQLRTMRPSPQCSAVPS